MCHLPFVSSYGSLHPASIHPNILRPAALLKFGPELGLVNAMPQGAKTCQNLTQLDPTSWIEEVSLPLTWCVVWSCFINPYVLYFLVSFLWVAHMLRSQVSGIHEIVPSCPCNTVQANKSTQLVQKNDQTCVRKKTPIIMNQPDHCRTASCITPRKSVSLRNISVSFAKLLAYRPGATLHIAQRKLQEGPPLEDHLWSLGITRNCQWFSGVQFVKLANAGDVWLTIYIHTMSYIIILCIYACTYSLLYTSIVHIDIYHL